MHSLTIGSQVQISQAKNNFPLEKSRGRSILVAGGIGITPMLSMALTLLDSGEPFELHYASKNEQSAVFFERLKSEPMSAHCRFYFSGGAEPNPLNVDALLQSAGPMNDIYVCGPRRLMDAVKEAGHTYGIDEGRLHFELFRSNIDDAAINAEFEVEVASSGARFTIPAGTTIVDVLGDAGIHIPTSCGEGVCGTCVTKVLSGQPLHRDSFLSEEERSSNKLITPCCSRAANDVLVLDL